MEFGIFSHMHVPHDDTEHARFLRELEISEAADAAGFKYDWAPEHHFLERYSHQPAPEVYLSWVAARTKRIHVGHAIVNITAPVNHPVRVAERIATMDHLSEGRVAFAEYIHTLEEIVQQSQPATAPERRPGNQTGAGTR